MGLGRWVDSQRQYYKKWKAGTPTSLTQERIDALNDLGFIWTAQKDDKSDDAPSPPTRPPKRKRGRPSNADIAAKGTAETQEALALRVSKRRKISMETTKRICR